MGSLDEIVCENCQMSFETKDLLSLHSCADIKEEISELDVNISDDPLSVYGIEEVIDPLSKVSEMINEGNVELTKAIDVVHQFHFKVHEGKNLNNESSVLQKQKNQLNQSPEMVCARRIVKPPNTEIIKVQPQKLLGENSIKFIFSCNKCNMRCSSLLNLQRHELIHTEEKPYPCSSCTMKFRNKDLADKHMNLRHAEFCVVCNKSFSKFYLKGHMLRKHQIEMIDNGKNQMQKQSETTIQGRKNLFFNHESVKNTDEEIHKEKVPFFYHTDIKQCIPKHEEIEFDSVFITENSWKMEIDEKPNQFLENNKEIFQDQEKYLPHPKKLSKYPKYHVEHTRKYVHEKKNPCSQCDATFITKRRLLIHLELFHEEKKENIEVTKSKKQKINKTDLPLLAPPNPSEMITKRQIFDHVYSLKITPGKCRSLDYQKHVLETVLCFKKLTIEKLSEPSVHKLETKVSRLTRSIYGNWRKCGAHRDGLYRRFQNNMQDLFDWVPEIVHDEKKDPIEMPKLYKQKSDETDILLLPLSISSEFLTKRQIFDDMYSRKITPGKYRTSEYQKIVLETVLSLKKVKLNELSDTSVQKLQLKAKGFTNPIYIKRRKNGCSRNGLYKKFKSNMEDPFEWIPELKENF